MNVTIYVRLLDEGVEVYRPVSAKRIDPQTYRIDSSIAYALDDEKWEFLPGSVVIVVERTLGGEKCLVASATVS